jgi:hypothetical protein
MHIQIYTEKVSNRLNYLCDVVFQYILRVPYKIIQSKHDIESAMPLINYSTTDIFNSLSMHPHNLLFEDDIKNQDIKVDIVSDGYYFFKTSDSSDFKYDLFASSFYLISRYEEYLSKEYDIHGRYISTNSLAYKIGFIRKAVVNRWALQIGENIKNKYPEFSFPDQKYSYLSTIDIDSVYAYKGKGFFRFAGSFFRSLLNKDFSDVNHRIKYLLGVINDPFDVYKYLFDRLATNNIDSTLFIQVGQPGKFDHNLKMSKKVSRMAIKYLESKTSLGIHPSYKSNVDFEILKSELESLQFLLNKKIIKSRQHYIKFTLPNTYVDLSQIGIKEDYSMGFADNIGFRAGICTPFPFFNLQNDTTTDIIIYPFQIMDVSLKNYLKLNSDLAIKAIEQIINEVRSVNGLFISIFHNESLSENNYWKGWRNVFETMIKLAK